MSGSKSGTSGDSVDFLATGTTITELLLLWNKESLVPIWKSKCSFLKSPICSYWNTGGVTAIWSRVRRCRWDIAHCSHKSKWSHIAVGREYDEESPWLGKWMFYWRSNPVSLLSPPLLINSVSLVQRRREQYTAR